jgi:hypothetical protein
MAARASVPPALSALVAAVLVALLIASAVTGQWLILVLGVVAVAAIALPYATRGR